MLLYLECLGSLMTYTLYYYRKRVFILGPSHHFFLSDCALSSQTCYETPLYNLDIDMDSKDTSICFSIYPISPSMYLLVYPCIY